METYTFKTVSDCRIKADVYRDSGGNAPRPTVMAIHGGALITGAREPIQMDFYAPLMKQGFAIVSIDYRLAPETKLPEIIKDVQDAYRWIREEGPALFGADPDRIGVQGGSAGGYLTLMTGFCVDPRPKALVSFYGYGDIIGDWYGKPDPFYCSQPAISKEAAYSAVGKGTPCGNPQGESRWEFYLYCRQHGLWPEEVSGFDPHTQSNKFKPYCPVQNVTRDYPPTFLGHGDKDTDVPYDQSVLMAEALKQTGVEHEFMTLHDAGHGFSHSRKGDYEQVRDRGIAFLIRHLTGG
ncbi:MAG: alpha/beta hydrolase [bacterium]|nr:alpha/beta hydrolase [bacterium]